MGTVVILFKDNYNRHQIAVEKVLANDSMIKDYLATKYKVDTKEIQFHKKNRGVRGLIYIPAKTGSNGLYFSWEKWPITGGKA